MLLYIGVSGEGEDDKGTSRTHSGALPETLIPRSRRLKVILNSAKRIVEMLTLVRMKA